MREPRESTKAPFCPLALLASVLLVSAACGCASPEDRDPTTGQEKAAAVPLVALTVKTQPRGKEIPASFSGLSFEMGSMLVNHSGVQGYLLDPTNTQALTLFQQLDIRHLRMGGGSVENVQVPPQGADGGMDFTGIDKMLDFAQAGHMQVLYTLRLLNGDAGVDGTIASHIWLRNPSLIDTFAIGNEPDFKAYHDGTDPQITDYPSYLADWKSFATEISGKAAGARFSGPDTGSNWPVANPSPYGSATDTSWDPSKKVFGVNGEPWTVNFARDIRAWPFPNSSSFSYVTQHNYPLEGISGLSQQQAIDGALLGSLVSSDYPALYNAALSTSVLPSGMGFRLTESNPYSGGLDGGNNTFAAALWALDYLHWWAANGCAGVNFHNKQWGANNVIFLNGSDLEVLPAGYGIKAWSLGGHGYLLPITPPTSPDLTAYAIGSANELFVTIVNKAHGIGAQDVAIALTPDGFAAASAASLVLSDGKVGDASLTSATLGGAPIPNDGRWQGTWTPLSSCRNQCTLTVPAASAAVVHLRAASAYSGPIQINQNGELELFGTGIANDTWKTQQSSDSDSSLGNWTSWIDVGGGIQTASTQGGAAVVKNLDNTVGFFVSTSAGRVYYKAQLTPGGGFGDWFDLGGSGIADLQAANNADGSLQVFGVGANGHVWAESQTWPGGDWTHWIDLGGASIRGGFVVGQDLNGRLELVAVDGSGTAWRNSQGISGGWSGWASLPGASLHPRLAIARNLDGRLEVFGIDAAGAVWQAAQTEPSGPWAGWSMITGKKLQPGLVVGQNDDGRLVLFGVDAAQPHDVFNLWQQSSPDDSFGGDWTDMGGAGIKQLVVGNTADFRIQLFGIGADGHVYSDWQATSGGGWAGWSDFGHPAGGGRFYAPMPIAPPVPGADAGTSLDAAMPSDASLGPDGSTPPTAGQDGSSDESVIPATSGCGCELGSTGGTVVGMPALLFALLFLRRRQRANA